MNTFGRSWLTVAFVVACICHLVGLYSPRAELPGDVPNSDKLAHFLGFGIPVALGWLRFAARRVWVVAAFVVSAVLSEIAQGLLLSGRSGDPLDTVADLVGVGIGVAVGIGITVLRKPARTPS